VTDTTREKELRKSKNKTKVKPLLLKDMYALGLAVFWDNFAGHIRKERSCVYLCVCILEADIIAINIECVTERIKDRKKIGNINL
jgi:hypothetical protein